MFLYISISLLLVCRHAHALKLSRVFADLSAFSLVLSSSACYADSGLLQGTVSIKDGVVPPSGEKVALYITARADPGVWVSAVRNIKNPPVLATRITSIESFPYAFTITDEKSSTPEGINTAAQWKSGALPLAVSARLDSDGVAATRSPEDLIGQGKAKFVNGNWEDVKITLEGRGVAGKFITEKKQ
jgi:hypothetical protein